MAEVKKKKSVFETLGSIDTTADLVTKGEGKYQISYVPWAKSIEKLRSYYPDATIEECTFKTKKLVSAIASKTAEGETYDSIVVEQELPYGTDGKTCWVKTCVRIPSENIEEYCTLPVMDNRNQAIKLEDITSTDVNKTLRRCVAKNIAYLGYGLSAWMRDDYTDLAKDQMILTGLEQNSEIEKFKSLITKGYDRDMLVKWLQINFKTTNPRTIKNEEILAKLSEELDKLDIKDFTPAKKAK